MEIRIPIEKLVKKTVISKPTVLLKDVKDKIENGIPVLLKIGDKNWSYISQKEALSYADVRQLQELPTVKADFVSLREERKVFELFLKKNRDFVFIKEKENILGAISSRDFHYYFLNELWDKKVILDFFIKVLNENSSFLWRIYFPLDLGREYHPEIEIFGDIYSIFGVKNKELIKKVDFFKRYNDKKILKNELENLRKKRGKIENIHSVSAPDGKTFYFKEYKSMREDREGGKIIIEAVEINITDIMLSKIESELFSRVYEAMMSGWSKDSFDKSLEILSMYIPVETAGILIKKEDMKDFRTYLGWEKEEVKELLRRYFKEMYNLQDKPGVFPLREDSYMYEIIKKKKPVYVKDTSEGIYYGDKVKHKCGSNSYYAVPLVLKEEAKIIIIYASRKKDAFDSLARELLNRVSLVFSSAINRWSYEENLKELNNLLIEKIEERTHRLKLLWEFSEKTSSIYDFRKLYKEFFRILHFSFRNSLCVVATNLERKILISGPFKLGEKELDFVKREILEHVFSKETKDLKIEFLSLIKEKRKISFEDFKNKIFKIPFGLEDDKIKGIFFIYIEGKSQDKYLKNEISFLNTFLNSLALQLFRIKTVYREYLAEFADNLPMGLILFDEKKHILGRNKSSYSYDKFLHFDGKEIVRIFDKNFESFIPKPKDGEYYKFERDGKTFEARAFSIKKKNTPSSYLLILKS